MFIELIKAEQISLQNWYVTPINRKGVLHYNERATIFAILKRLKIKFNMVDPQPEPLSH